MPKIHVQGLRMYYEYEGTGTPLVLISSLSGDHLAWALQVPSFGAAGYKCLVFDNRDAGQTDSSTIQEYDIRRLAEDTAALMHELGISSAHILGASMGGMVAQELAINYPERVLSLTLVCTVPVVDSWLGGIITSWKRLRPNGATDDLIRTISPWLFTYRYFAAPEPLLSFLQMIRDAPFPQSAACFGRQCDAVLSHDARNRLGAIQAPTHVIVGAEDNLTPPRYSRTLARHIPGTKVTEIPAAAHGVFWERPEEFTRAVLDFLQRVRRR